jgi:hypothetical protein
LSLVTALVVLVAATASAHEIGTTQVDVTLHQDQTYVVDILTGGDSLLVRVERRAGLPRTQRLSPTAVAQRLEQLAPQFLAAVDLRFDGVAVRPAMHVLRVDAPGGTSPSSITIRLSGDIPQPAREVTWQYRLTYSTYSIAFANEGETATPRRWLEGDQRSPPFALSDAVRPPGRLTLARRYLRLGFIRIAPYGIEQIVFVLAMFLLAARVMPMLLQIAAFIAAQSIGLGLATYGIGVLSPNWLSGMVAVSITYVALENVVLREVKPWRIGVIFVFGLVHGAALAAVLRELGLPHANALTAWMSFNVGVVAAEVATIAAAFVLVTSWAQTRPWYRYRVVVPSSAAMAVVATFWMLERVG